MTIGSLRIFYCAETIMRETRNYLCDPIIYSILINLKLIFYASTNQGIHYLFIFIFILWWYFLLPVLQLKLNFN